MNNHTSGWLASSERAQTEFMQGYLRSFNPEFEEVAAQEGRQYRSLMFKPSTNPSEWRMPGSDGTLRAVAILLAIFQSRSGTPISLVGLEEPENNLHPAAAGILLDALLEGSRRVPIIASTHSADMLDRKDLPEKNLLVVELHNGETIIGPIDESGKSILRNRLYTAGELLRNNQLTPERGIATPQ
jgi:predicted ATPase